MHAHARGIMKNMISLLSGSQSYLEELDPYPTRLVRMCTKSVVMTHSVEASLLRSNGQAQILRGSSEIRFTIPRVPGPRRLVRCPLIRSGPSRTGAPEGATPTLSSAMTLRPDPEGAQVALLRRTTFMSLEDDLRETRARRAQALTKKVRAEAETEAAEARVAAAQKTMESMGVKDVKQGRAKLEKLKAKLDAKKEEIDAKLTEAGA